MDVDIHSILFRPDDRIEITYAEKREQSDAVAVVRTIVMDRSKFANDISDLEIQASELVDAGLEALRNPPERERER